MKTNNKSNARLVSLLLLAIALMSLSGCVVPGHRHARVVVIETGHAHSEHCGHYRHGKKWYHAKGHKHGHRCGHHFVGGVWIIR